MEWERVRDLLVGRITEAQRRDLGTVPVWLTAGTAPVDEVVDEHAAVEELLQWLQNARAGAQVLLEQEPAHAPYPYLGPAHGLAQQHYHKALLDAGHRLACDADGNIEIRRNRGGVCAGPRCTQCHREWCHYCRGLIVPCSAAAEEVVP
jgi:hypothetical protein